MSNIGNDNLSSDKSKGTEIKRQPDVPMSPDRTMAC